ncbi:hypothetical protein GCM10027398_15290 [Azotobacter salinestris]
MDGAFRALPPEHRRILTSHDAFGYLGQAYRLDILAPQGLSTEREPSAAELAMLLRQIAEESGAGIGGTLYSDALAAEGPASTYLGLYRHNVATLLGALRR